MATLFYSEAGCILDDIQTGLPVVHLPAPVACDRSQSSASVVAGQTGGPCSQSLATYTGSGPSTGFCRGTTMVDTSAIS